MRALLLLLLLASPVVAQPVMPFSPAGGGASGYANDPNACQVSGGANCQMLAQIRGSAGTALLPSFASPAANANNDGLYFPSATSLALAVEGVLRLTLSTTGFLSTLVWQGPAGSAAAPSIAVGGSNDGIFQPAAGNVGVSTGGAVRLTINSTAATTTVPVLLPNGTAALPALSFSGDTNTGIFNAAADDIGLAVNGVSELRLTATALRPEASQGLSLGTLTQGWNQVFSTGGSTAAAYANINDTDTGLYFNSTTSLGLTLNNAAFVNLFSDRVSLITSTGSMDFNNSGNVQLSPTTPSAGSIGGFVGGSIQFAGTANTMRGTAPTAIASCAASTSGLIVYKEDTDTVGTNSQLCLCARNNGALTYSWIPIGGSLTGTCT